MATPEQTTRTSITALKPPLTGDMPAVSMGFSTLQSFELLQRAAKLLAASTLVPKQYVGNLPNCVIALNMAGRIGADPLLVMQNLYVVHGNPGWSAKFLIACFNQCGRFSAVRYRWTGTKGKDDWGCTAYSKEYATDTDIEGPEITIALAKQEGWYQKNGSKWQTIPQLMLMYRAAAWMINTHAPEISMGLQTAEEIHDVFDTRRGDDGTYEVTLEDIRPGAPAAGETVDEETGEVDDPSTADLKWTVETATKALESKRKLETLQAQWQEIVADYTAIGQRVPDEVDAKHTELKEALEEREAIQGDGEPAQDEL